MGIFGIIMVVLVILVVLGMVLNHVSMERGIMLIAAIVIIWVLLRFLLGVA